MSSTVWHACKVTNHCQINNPWCKIISLSSVVDNNIQCSVIQSISLYAHLCRSYPCPGTIAMIAFFQCIYISTTVYKQLYCYLTCETARLRRWQTQWTKTVYGLSFVMSAFNPLRSLAIAAAPSNPRPIICRNINRV